MQTCRSGIVWNNSCSARLAWGDWQGMQERAPRLPTDLLQSYASSVCHMRMPLWSVHGHTCIERVRGRGLAQGQLSSPAVVCCLAGTCLLLLLLRSPETGEMPYFLSMSSESART